MSDYDFPELPSDEELGLSEEDLKDLEKEFEDDGPEMSAEEMAALLGEAPPPPATQPKAPAQAPPASAASKGTPAAKGAGEKPPSGGAPEAQGPSKKELRAAEAAKRKARKKAEKDAAKAAKAQAKAEKKAAKDLERAAAASATPEGEEEEPAEKPPVDEGPRSKWRGPATVALLFAVCVVASSRTGLPRPVPANAPEADFSSARAMATLVEIAREAHPPGSPEHGRVRGYLVDRLTSLGFEPAVQTTTSMIQNASFARAATVRNIVARLPGTASTGAVLVTAHYDSREIALGAADDGSGVVTILEALRALRTGPALQNDLIVLLTDAEELGLLGARAFVDEHPWMDDVRLAISIEMRGGAGPSIMFETGEENGWIVRALKAADPSAYGNSMSYEIYQRLPNDTDFTPFKEAGIQGLNFAAIDNAHVYHQVYDSPENMSESTLQHHGMHALGVLRHLGDQDLTTVDAPNVTYFNAPGFGFVAYGMRWILPISVGLLVLFVLALLGTRAGTGGFSGVVIGMVLSVVGGALSYGAGHVLVGWLPGFHPELDSLHGSAFHSEGWYLLALAGAVLTIVTALHSIARRWVHLTSLALGAAIVPLVGAAYVSYAMPLAAMNLQWPVAAALTAVLVLGVLRKNAPGIVGWVLAVGFAVPVLIFLEPLVELVWIAMSFRLAGVLAVLIAMAAYLCLPALDGLRHPNSWWAPAASLVFGAAALGIGVLTSRSTADRPAPSTLVYALDHSSREALWVTDPNADSTDLAAREWAVARAGSAFDGVRDMRGFGYRAGDIPVTTAAVVEAAGPEVLTEFGDPENGVRRVLISVRSQVGAELLRFQYASESNTRLVAINGKALESPDDLVWAEHWGEPDPVVILTLEVPVGEPLRLDIIEHLLRPEELLGAAAFDRPEELAPDITRMSDRAMLLTRFTAMGQASDGPSVDLQQMLDSIGAANEEDVPEATPDTTGVSADTTGVAEDSVAVVRDTTGVAADSTGAVPDTSVVESNGRGGVEGRRVPEQQQ